MFSTDLLKGAMLVTDRTGAGQDVPGGDIETAAVRCGRARLTAGGCGDRVERRAAAKGWTYVTTGRRRDLCPTTHQKARNDEPEALEPVR